MSDKVSELSSNLSQLLTKNNELLERIVVQAATIKNKLSNTTLSNNTDKIQLLQQENEELSRTIEIIMNKYRNLQMQMLEQKKEMKEEYEIKFRGLTEENDQLRRNNLFLEQKINEMMKVIRDAVSVEEDSLVEELMKENEGLREMLKIANDE